jgi:hypothetical protein
MELWPPGARHFDFYRLEKTINRRERRDRRDSEKLKKDFCLLLL